MHLLEACPGPGSSRCRSALARRGRCAGRTVSPTSLRSGGRLLGEFYDEAGEPHPETGQWVEPGHQFEWAWLLHAHAARRSIEAPVAADALIEQATRMGIDPDGGGLWDRIDRAGGVVVETKRIWPVCETIKAHALRWRRRGDDADRAAMISWLEFLSRHYLRDGGRWHETLNRDLSPLLSDMPGTTPYHLLMMAEEALPALAVSAQ
ncbi:MAG: AGE family epimerase/isomerase [Aliidongia sp.]